ncbi:hypothetical protein FJY84_06875 [Candidatus Bathyarchaeota archaeon]|nr:hypothetical protein [Candidatus Bathyarchaeota archaeon]
MSGVDELRELNSKLEAVMHRLDYLEAILTESRNYPELAGILRDLRVGAGLYGEPLKLIQRLIGLRRLMQRDSELRDETSRALLNALAMKGPMNISALTREVAQAKGKSSRVTVRKRVQELLAEGIIEKDEGNLYRLVE